MKSGPLRDLVEAMDDAESRHRSIPCKSEPELWTHDLINTGSHGAGRLRTQAVLGCQRCPVFDQCCAYLTDRNKSRKTQLFGVVAGAITELGHVSYLNNARRIA